MSELQYIQWFPGHMTKTVRLIEASRHSVDIIMEIIDARIPYSSRSDEVYRATVGKPRIIVLNKADLADPEATRRWLEYYGKRAAAAVAISAKQPRQARQILKDAAEKACSLLSARSSIYKPRIMVVGVPNSGKSTVINALVGSSQAKAEDRPGVTRGKQWLSCDFAELLDMPGVLSKKFSDQRVACRLAFTGAIKDDILDRETLASELLGVLAADYPDRLAERYKIEPAEELSGYDLLEQVARRRGMLLKGAQPDTLRAAAAVLDEYRGGLLGKITLEEPRL